MRFEFATATRIVFGAGSIREVPALARHFGPRALVVAGRTAERAAGLLNGLRRAGIECVLVSVPGEPTTEWVRSGAIKARSANVDSVISLGGGSVVDAGKAIAALMTNQGDLLDYLEVVGKGRSLENPPVPFVAIPTTAGAGAEVTRNAVLVVPEHRVKVSLRSPLMLPRVAVVDPELTLELPFAVTASTGLDALTQLIEPFLSCKANPLTDALCREGMLRVARSLRRACTHPADLEARRDMSLASLFSGLALANAGLGAVHGFAAPIGGMWAAPHGAVCAALLPHVLDVNLRALRERKPGSDVLARFAEVARLLTGNPAALAADSVEWVRDLCIELKIPGLGNYGICETDVAQLCQKAEQASSMKGNPISLTPLELAEIVGRAIPAYRT